MLDKVSDNSLTNFKTIRKVVKITVFVAKSVRSLRNLGVNPKVMCLPKFGPRRPQPCGAALLNLAAGGRQKESGMADSTTLVENGGATKTSLKPSGPKFNKQKTTFGFD